MDAVEKECGALGGLFQVIINDLKIGVPLWEDFIAKATKLHCQLKATSLATSAFLDSFQRIADAATNTRGATKDIGSALTRICLRQRSVESRLKTFTSSIMESLVIPLQERMEEWRKTTSHLDKEHTKEYKKARQEIKKKSSDTMRLQKKVKKSHIRGDLQRSLDCALHDINDKFLLLEETEKQAVRTALIEERSRFCVFVGCLKPVLDEEVGMISEVTHLQEALETLIKHSSDPFTLPSGSEQVIIDIKSSDGGTFTFQTPPSSPNTSSSIGSRKSSVCSISSLTSSSSSSTKSHSSPSHHYRQYRSISQQPVLANGMMLSESLRLSSLSSQDSGFTSQDTLFLKPSSNFNRKVSNGSDNSSNGSTSTSCVGTGSASSMTSSTPSSPYYPLASANNATWPLQDSSAASGQFDKTSPVSVAGFISYPTNQSVINERPHTISTAYEKSGHARPALTAQTFQPLEVHTDQGKFQDQQGNTLAQPSRDSTASSVTPTSPAATMIGDVMPSQDPIRTSVYNATSSDDSGNTPTSENNPPLPTRYNEMQLPSLADKPTSCIQDNNNKPSNTGHNTTSSTIVPDFNQTAPNQIVPQPIYMNMDEIADSENTTKIPPTSVSSCEHQDYNETLQNNQRVVDQQAMLYSGHRRQSSNPQVNYLTTSHSSGLSSSGYGSGSIPTSGANQDSLLTEEHEDVLICLSKYSTLPRNGEWLQTMFRNYSASMSVASSAGRQQSRRPLSAAEIGSTATLGCRGSNGIRRSSSNVNRPPPPVRRSSAITNPNAITIGTLRKNSLHAAECIYGISSQRQSSSESVNCSPSDAEIQKPTGSGEVVEEDQSRNRANLIQHLNAKIAEQEENRRQSVSDIRSAEVAHKQNVHRKSGLQKQIVETIAGKHAERNNQQSITSPQVTSTECNYRVSGEQKSLTLGHTERQSLIHSLNTKLTQQLSHITAANRSSSPDRAADVYHQSVVHQQRSHQHQHPTVRQFSQPNMSSSMPNQEFGNQYSPPPPAFGTQNFKESLNIRLRNSSPVNVRAPTTQQFVATRHSPRQTASPVRRSVSGGNGDQVAERARQWLATRAHAQDTATCRESLLEQIKRGTRLRKVSRSDDRSGPRLS